MYYRTLTRGVDDSELDAISTDMKSRFSLPSTFTAEWALVGTWNLLENHANADQVGFILVVMSTMGLRVVKHSNETLILYIPKSNLNEVYKHLTLYCQEL